VSDTLKPADIRHAIASSVSDLKAYEVAAFCTDVLGLSRPFNERDDPFSGKYRYVDARLKKHRMSELLGLARTILADRDDDVLQGVVDRAGLAVGGVAGELRNLIFASSGPKPEIVLRDAVNNVIEITKGADSCLVYDEPIPEAGLTWAALTDWWTRHPACALSGDDETPARTLWRRLYQSMGSDAEAFVFNTYTSRYGTNVEIPALIPQVYLHYDPYLRRIEQRPGTVVRQRMDFLLLLRNRRRVVIEVDGKQHYADDRGRADPARYATMVAEDRRLRLTGYEVYRFGGSELLHDAIATETLNSFFGEILSDTIRPHL
jgi:hypothetical protein